VLIFEPNKIQCASAMKTKQFLSVSLFFIGLAQAASGQSVYSLKARIINARQEPVAVHAQLLSVRDSTEIAGDIFPEGSVTFNSVKQPNALLRLSSMSFTDTLIFFQNNNISLLDLGTIVMRESNIQLNEVRISSQAPLVRQGSNGTVEVQVSGTILAGSTGVNQVLERSPGVVFNEGRIHVVGKGEALLFLNNQVISYEQMAAIPVSQILRVEVIANPSSRYDAEGKAVIRIITKMNTESGTTGSVTQQYTYSNYAGGESNTLSDLNHRRGKVTLAANYTLRAGNEREVLHTIRSRPAESNYLRSDLTTEWLRKMRNFSGYGIGIQYDANKNTYFSVGYKGNYDKLGGNQNSKNNIDNATSRGIYNSLLAKDEERLNHSMIFNYNHTLDSLGSSLFFGSQFAQFNTDIHDLINENNAVNDSSFTRKLRNEMFSDITISSSQADYTKAFGNNNKLEAGAKFTYAHTGSGTDFLIATSTDFEPDPKLSSRFEYTELVPAAYFNFSGKLSKSLRFAAGARGEWTRYELNTTASGGQVLKRSYFNVFPNLLITRPLTSESGLRLSYVAKITRPRYQALNPWVIYQDPFTSIQGNPGLLPEKVHSFEIGMNYKQLDFRGGYNYTRDPLSGAALRGDGPNSYVLKGINLEKDHTIFVSGSAAFTLNWWNSTNTVTLSRSNSVDRKYGFELVKPRPQLYLYTSNTFSVTSLFKIQVLAWYLGAKYYGLYYNESRATVTVGIERDFFKNAWKLRLTANDIFHQTNAAGTYSVGETDIYFNRAFSTSYFNINLAYRFGKSMKTTYRSKSTAETEQNRAR
jgi:hypothetical protein